MRLTASFLMVAMLAAAPTAAWAAKTPESAVLRASLAVEVAADGRVSAVELAGKHAKELPPSVREPLLADARTWRFEPAMREGTPVPSSTHVHLTLRAEPVDADGEAWALRIARASNGPTMAKMRAPHFPTIALRNNATAHVVAKVDIAADGTVTDARLSSVDMDNRDRRFSGAFVEATLKAVRKWQFTPERVAGEPIAATVLVPVSFCIGRAPCAAPEDPDTPVGDEAVALEPATNLLTELAGRVL